MAAPCEGVGLVIRVVMIYDRQYCDLPPVIAEYDEADPGLAAGLGGIVSAMRDAPDVASFSVQRVTQWWPATWSQVLAGCEVRSEEDGSTWVVARGISPVSPHEVEVYKFGQPELRHTFTPQYNAPVMARMTSDSSALALLMTELGATIIDDGKGA